MLEEQFTPAVHESRIQEKIQMDSPKRFARFLREEAEQHVIGTPEPSSIMGGDFEAEFFPDLPLDFKARVSVVPEERFEFSDRNVLERRRSACQTILKEVDDLLESLEDAKENRKSPNLEIKEDTENQELNCSLFEEKELLSPPTSKEIRLERPKTPSFIDRPRTPLFADRPRTPLSNASLIFPGKVDSWPAAEVLKTLPERQDELKTPRPVQEAETRRSPPHEPISWSYAAADGGRLYYYHGERSQWECPNELRQKIFGSGSISASTIFQASLEGTNGFVKAYASVGELAISDSAGRSPLHYACAGGQRKCVHVLLNACCTLIGIPDRNGTSPLAYAARYGYLDILEELVRLGASLTSLDNEGNSALTEAATYGHSTCAEFLGRIGHGKLLWIKNVQGYRPSEIALRHSQNAVASLLVKMMKDNRYAEDNLSDDEDSFRAKKAVSIMKSIQPILEMIKASIKALMRWYRGV